ncbi:MAG: hypothetical protein QOH88_1748 [Verrucomicrobiota bacterium]|jgi:hypothetical protein
MEQWRDDRFKVGNKADADDQMAAEYLVEAYPMPSSRKTLGPLESGPLSTEWSKR